MANSPGKNIFPQHNSTPVKLKKNLKCNAFSTPKTITASADCQQVVEDFKLFLDGLGIADGDDTLDEETDCTLEDELSKLETTLKNIELENSIEEIVHDCEKDVEYSDCKDVNSSSLVVPDMHEASSADDTVTHNECGKSSSLKEDTSNDHFAEEIQEFVSEENTKCYDCKDECTDSKLVYLVSPKGSSETDYLTLDESGEVAFEVFSNVLTKCAPNNNSNPLLDTEKNKHESEEDSKNEDKLIDTKLSPFSPKSNSETDYLTLDESGEMSDEISTNILSKNVPNNNNNNNNFLHDIEQSKHESNENIRHSECKDKSIGSKLLVNPVSPKNSSETDYLTMDESGEMLVATSNNTFNKDDGSNDSVQMIEVIKKLDQDITFIGCFPGKACIANKTKVDSIPCEDTDEDVSLKSKLISAGKEIGEHETVIGNVDNVTDTGRSCPKDDISPKEVDNEIYIIGEMKNASLSTNKDCLNVAETNTIGQSSEDKTVIDRTKLVQLAGEEVKSPRKCLNDVNKENEIVICLSPTAARKFLPKVDADLNKENILDKPSVAEIVATGAKKDVVRVAEEFISLDPEENKDNNNEKWEELRKLTTNPERYRALCQRWQNISNPDPNKNLTTRRCFRKNFIRKKLTAKCVPKKFRKAVEVDSDNADNELMRKLRKRKYCGIDNGEPDAKKSKTYPCTILYDEQMAIVKKAMHEELISVDVAEKEALTKLTLLQQLEQERLRYREGHLYRLTPNAGQLRNRQDTETLVALGHFQNEKKKIEDSRHAELSKLKAAADEIYAFHSFYNGITEDNVNTLLLTEEQVLHLRDIEDYYNKIYEIYYNNGS